MDLTDALAYSNNYYFANLGIKLGYERVNYYAHLFGYGEKAGLNVEGEHAGFFPAAPPKNGGMGMLTSFGEEISQTPLELAGSDERSRQRRHALLAAVSAVAGRSEHISSRRSSAIWISQT